MSRNILVAFGGVSPEHEVSVITALQAVQALKETGNTLIPLYVTKSGRFLTGPVLLELEAFENLKTLEEKASPCAFRTSSFGKTVLTETESAGLFRKPKTHAVDVALTAFHGSDGENGGFQGLCEMYNLAYTGSGSLASSMGMNKRAAKLHAKAVNVPVVRDVLIRETDWVKNKRELIGRVGELGYPVFVKPLTLGSSIGVERVSDQDAFKKAVETAFRYDDSLLAEEAVHPLIEINCSVLGDGTEARASVCEQPLGKEEALSFTDKYMGDEGKGMASASRIIPAPISETLTKKIQQASLELFKSMEASGVARFDFLVQKETGDFYFNEINTIPGSFSFYLWEKSGIGFTALLQEMLEIAVRRHKARNGRIRSYETNLLSQKAVKGIKGLKGKG